MSDRKIFVVKNYTVFDREAREKLSEEFLDYALPIAGITREEFDEFARKVRSGEIKIDNDVE